MNRAAAWGAVAVASTGTIHALLGPSWAALAWLLLATAIAPSRATFWLAATSLPFHILFLGFLLPGTWQWGPWGIGQESVTTGTIATLRLAALLAIPAALVQRIPPPVLIDRMGLPRGVTAVLAAIWLATQDLVEDWQQLRRAQKAYGEDKPMQALAAMLARAVRRGETRVEALTLAGAKPRPSLAPITAFAALGAVGRMATVAIPNVAPTYFIIFLAGWWGGAWVGFASGALAMLVTDLLLSGPSPTGLVNVPAMAFVGLLGGVLRAPLGHGVGRSVSLAAVGVLLTLGFSVVSDSFEWLILPELRNTPGAWSLRVGFGLAFNLPAALANAALFAAVVPTATKGLDALRST